MCQGLGPKKHDEISEIDCEPDLLQASAELRPVLYDWLRLLISLPFIFIMDREGHLMGSFYAPFCFTGQSILVQFSPMFPSFSIMFPYAQSTY